MGIAGLTDVPVDSPKGARMLIDWARAHKAVLNPVHRKIAERHGISVEGVMFSDPMPIHWMRGHVGTSEGLRPMTRDELDKMNG